MANDPGERGAAAAARKAAASNPSEKRASLTGSGFEKRGGYEATGSPVAKLPKVQSGPAPGAVPAKSETTNRPAKRDGGNSSD